VNAGQVISSVISGVAVLLLAGITRSLFGVRADFRRFMLEHTWLIATTLWTRDKVIKVMQQMDLDPGPPPPADLPPPPVNRR
jgi:hypothetical protein